jgi:hypothetical protein
VTPNLTGVNLEDAVGYVKEHAKGVNVMLVASATFAYDPNSKNKLTQEKASLVLQEAIPLGAVLQWIEDRFGVVFFLREYGMVVQDAQRAPPAAAPLLQEWKRFKSLRATETK